MVTLVVAMISPMPALGFRIDIVLCGLTLLG